MSTQTTDNAAAPVFRIDRFDVPADALAVFIDRVRRTQRKLDTVPGCRQNLMLTRTGDLGEIHVMTIVEWDSAQSMAAAAAVMQMGYREEGFDPAGFMRRLGVRADMATYGIA